MVPPESCTVSNERPRRKRSSPPPAHVVGAQPLIAVRAGAFELLDVE
jgi:hypothetical protein